LDELRKDEIRNFLKEFKEIASKRGIDLVPRRETNENLAQLGLTKKNCKEEIITLSLANYCKCPEPDRDKLGEIWVFGKQVEDKEVYIKLKIAQVGEEKIAKCLSFHTPNFPLCYPYKEELKKGGDRK